jgi:hypothetical protein
LRHLRHATAFLLFHGQRDWLRPVPTSSLSPG